MDISLTPKQLRLIQFALDAIYLDVEDFLDGSEFKESDLYKLQDYLRTFPETVESKKQKAKKNRSIDEKS